MQIEPSVLFPQFPKFFELKPTSPIKNRSEISLKIFLIFARFSSLAKSLGSNPVTYSETATNPFDIHSYILMALGCNTLEYKNSLRLSIIPSLSKANLKTYPSMRIPTRFVPDPNCDHGNLYLSKRS